MKIEAQKINDANISISATITKIDIESEINIIAKSLAKTTDLPGFRKGKVPVLAVKKHFGKKLEDDALSKKFQNLLSEGLSKFNVEPSKIITEPTFTKFEKQDDGSIEVEVFVSLQPTVDITDYKEVIPEVEIPEISDEDVEKEINSMLQKSAPFVEVDKAVENGDTVVLDFEGFIDGEAFEGGSAQDYSLNIGSGSFIPGFEEQLIGLKKGDKKDVVVTFPKEYGNDQLKGKETIFKCEIKLVQIKEDVELNEENATRLLKAPLKDGENPIEALKAEVKEDLKNIKLSEIYNNETKPKLRLALAEKFTFDLPKSVLEQEVEQRVNQVAQKLSKEEIEEIQNNPEKLEELKNEHLADAETSVRITFIIDALSKKLGIKVSDKEVQEVIYYESMMNGQDAKVALEQYQKAGYLPLIKMSILEDKVLSNILEEKLK